MTDAVRTPPPTARSSAAWRAILSPALGRGCLKGLCVAGWVLLGLYVGFLVLVLVLRHVVLPRVDEQRPWIEQRLSDATGAQIRLGRVDARLAGIWPELSIDQVEVRDAQGQLRMQWSRVDAVLAWESVLKLQPIFHRLQVRGPALDVRRRADGRFEVAGFVLDPARSDGDGRGLRWLLAQHEIALTGGALRWTDEVAGTAPIAFQNVNLLAQNRGLTHRLGLQADPVDKGIEPLDLRAQFTHRLLRPVDDVRNWRGQVFVQLDRADIAGVLRRIPLPALGGLTVTQGQGAVRGWVDFDALRITQVTADVQLSRLVLKFAPDLAPLDLSALSGRIEGRQLAAESLAHEVSVRGLTLTLPDGRMPAPMNLAERFVPASQRAGAQGMVSAEALDLALLHELSERLPLSPVVRSALAAFEPQGRVGQLSVEWQVPQPGMPEAVTRYKARGDFEGLGLRAQPDRSVLAKLLTPELARSNPPASAAAQLDASTKPLPIIGLPGFSNLSGRFAATESGGELSLASRGVVLEFPGVFEAPVLPATDVGATARWKLVAGRLEVEVPQLRFANADAAGDIKASYRSPSVGQSGPGELTLTGALARAELRAVHRYLPARLPEATRHWVRDALLSGRARDVQFRLKGDLKDFPFAPDAQGRSSGEFQVSARVQDAALDYVRQTPNPEQRWLPLEDIDAQFVMDRTRMEVRRASALVLDTRLSNVTVLIPDLNATAQRPMIISGDTQGPGQDLVRYVNASPISGWIGQFTRNTEIAGNAGLRLRLSIPIADSARTEVQGSLKLANNAVRLDAALPVFEDTTATLDFTERTLRLRDGRATVYGGPVSFSGGSQAEGGLQFRGEGLARVSEAKAIVGEPTLMRLIDAANGQFRYSVQVDSRAGAISVALRSDLQGVSFDLPGVLRKQSAESLPLLVSIVPQRPAAQPASDELLVELGSTLAVRLQRQRSPQGGMAIVRGGIGVNNEAVLPDVAGVIAIINLDRVDVDDWSRKLRALAITGVGDAVVGGPAVSIGPGMLPKLIALQARELVVGGKRLTRVVAGATREGDVWQLNLDSPQISGYATWRQNERDGALGQLTARLAKLSIPQGERDQVVEFLESAGAGEQGLRELPAIDLVAEQFELGGRRFGRLEVLAQNQGARAGNAWVLERLVLSQPAATLTGSGLWRRPVNRGSRSMELDFKVDVRDAGNLLGALGFPGVMRAGRGELGGRLSWIGSPLSFDVPSLDGQLKLELDQGQWLRQDPGVARLLGVFSLQNLVRRFTFDFRDVFAQGFSYDTVRAEASLAKGVLQTESFKMRGAQAGVAMAGVVDLVRETQNLHIIVTPDLNLGAVSFAYLFINPAVGLGTLLAQAAVRDSVNKGLSQEFDLQGTWRDPVVKPRPKPGQSAEPNAAQISDASAVQEQNR
jgi:uncharacterized protein (TIGR02099 family)